jgi:putative PIN family toxin of toxin-antitoxin system
LLRAASDGLLVLFTSAALLTEFRGVLARPHLAGRLTRQRSTVDEAAGLYAALAVEVRPNAAPRVVPRDADDDHVVAAAVAARADIIVTGDEHLLSLVSHAGISIVKPAEALRLLGQQA